MENFEKALIQQNNIRWITQKIFEGSNRPKAEPETKINFVSGSGFPARWGRKSSIASILIAQSLDSAVQGSCTPYAIGPIPFMDTHKENLYECPSCKYFSGDQFLRCAVNPLQMDDDCAEYEKLA